MLFLLWSYYFKLDNYSSLLVFHGLPLEKLKAFKVWQITMPKKSLKKVPEVPAAVSHSTMLKARWKQCRTWLPIYHLWEEGVDFE